MRVFVDIAYAGLVYPQILTRDDLALQLRDKTGCPWIYPTSPSSMSSVPSGYGTNFVQEDIYESYTSSKFMTRESCKTANVRLFQKEDTLRGVLHGLNKVFLKQGMYKLHILLK